MHKLLFFLLVFTCNLIFAQTDTIHGYVIINKADTIYGYFNKYDENTNSKYCEFTANKTGELIKYTPEDISGYRFYNSNYYIPKTITIKENTKKVFVEFLLKGEINLYYYGGSKLSTYFIEKEDGKLVYLEGGEKDIDRKVTDSWDRKKVRNEVIVTYRVDNNAYKGVLNYLLSDYPNAYKEILKTELQHNALIQLSENYHKYKCSDGECIIYAKDKKDNRFIYSLGIYSGSYNVYNTFYELPNKTNYLSSNGIIFGSELNIYAKKSMSRIFTTVRAGFGTSSKDQGETSYSESNIYLSLSLNAKILKSIFSPYLGIGYQHLSSSVKRNNFQYYESSVFRETSDEFIKKIYSPTFTGGLYWKINDKITCKGEYNAMITSNILYAESFSKKSENTNVVTKTFQQSILLSINIIIGKL